jgi:long-chain acyl-CoA synthetase
MTTPADTSLGQMFFDRARTFADVPAFRVRPKGAADFHGVTYREAARRAEAIATGLLTIPGGVLRRASVGIIGSTSADWILTDFAIMSIDAVAVPIYATLLAPEIGYIAQDAAIEVLVVENKALLDKVRTIQGGFTFQDKQWPASALKLRHFVVIDGTGVETTKDTETLADVEARGRGQLDAMKPERDARRSGTKREDVATYTYTSGTTGAPKGVIQTHHNWLSVVEASSELALFTESTRQSGAFLFLPLAHAFGRLIEFAAVFHGGPVILSGIDTLAEDLAKSRPGLLPAAPRVYEKIYARITAGVAAAPARRQKLFGWALAVGKETISYRQKKKPLPLVLRVQHAVADKLIFSKLRARLGLDRVESMITGSAPLAPVVHEFFMACGVMLFEAYGLTETCPGLTANRPEKWKLGTVGQPLRNVTLKIAEDGEILAKGPNVVSGYLNRDDANKDAFDSDGWFHTGDIGEFDGEGFLRITDRKKDLLKTSGGKYIAPQKIEGLLKSKPMIIEAIVIGDSRNFCTALLVLDDDAWKAWADKRHRKLDPRDPELAAELQRSINEVNRDLASFESIKYFRVVDTAPTVDNGMLTASFKIKRKEVNKRFQPLIDEMYEQKRDAA